MNNSFGIHIIRFILLMMAQILIFNNVNIGGVVNPYIYPMFLLLLPLELAPWAVILIGLGTGLTLDVFTGTIGMHAFASVLLCFLRAHVINLVSSSPKDLEAAPSVYNQGFRWFGFYMGLLLFAHHFTYFFIEIGNMKHPAYTLLKIIASTAVSGSIIIMLSYIFSSRKSRRFR